MSKCLENCLKYSRLSCYRCYRVGEREIDERELVTKSSPNPSSLLCVTPHSRSGSLSLQVLFPSSLVLRQQTACQPPNCNAAPFKSHPAVKAAPPSSLQLPDGSLGCPGHPPFWFVSFFLEECCGLLWKAEGGEMRPLVSAS